MDDGSVDKALDALRKIAGMDIEQRPSRRSELDEILSEASLRGAARGLGRTGRRAGRKADDILRYPKWAEGGKGGQFMRRGAPRGAVRRPLPEVRSIQTQRLLKDAAKKREQAAKALARGKPAEAMTLTGEARSLEAAIPVPEMASPGGDVLDGKSVRAVIDGLAYMEANFSDGSKAIIARGRDGKAVGYISYQTDVTDQRLILSDLKVAPEYRRRGIGTRLVEQARDANPMALAQTNERTPDGAALFSTMPEVEVAPEYAEDMDSAGPPVPFPDWVIENDLASLAMNPGWVATDVRRSGLDDSWTPEVPEGGYASGWEQNEQGEWQSPGMKSPGPDGKFTETETANIRMAVLRPDEWAERVRAQVGKQDELLDMEPGATVTDASGTTWRKVKKPPPREPGLTRSWEADSPTWVTDDGDMETSGGVAAKIMAPQWREDTMASPTKYDWPHWERGNTQFPISLSPRDIFTKSSEDGPDGELPERLSSWLANYDDSVINEILGVGRIARMMGHETPPETVDALKRGERITVYRSVPRGGDHGTMPGAFVTPSRAYAEQHGESNLNGDYVIVSVEASADELLSHGDPSEFVWAPRDEDDALRQTQKAAEQQGVELPEGLMAVGMASPDFQGYIGDPTPDGADVERAVSRTIGDLSERYAGVIDIPWFVASNRDALPFTGDWADDFFVATVATAGYSPDEGQTEAEMPRIQRVVRADQIADLSDESARLVDSFGLSPAEAAETLGFTPLSQVRLGDWLESRGSLNSAYAIMISLAGVDGEVEPGRVMLVDDSAIIIRAISNILAGGNTRNTIVADGVESLEDIVQVIVAHEFGHLVGDRAIGRNNQMAEDARARAYVDLFEEYGITPLAIAAVSPYATVSPVESFAEMYALYFTNREDMSMIPSGPGSDESLAAAFGRLLSERIPDHGDEVLPGMSSPDGRTPEERAADDITTLLLRAGMEAPPYETMASHIVSVKRNRDALPPVEESHARHMADIVSGGVLATRMAPETLIEVLADGGLKNAWQTGEQARWRQGAGTDERSYLHIRKRVERKLFGGRPVYGYVTDDIETLDPVDAVDWHRVARGYGAVVVVFKDSVKDRTTYTVADSLNEVNEVIPTPIGTANPLALLNVSNPDIYLELTSLTDMGRRSLGRMAGLRSTYVEAQIHGSPPAVPEIERVIITDLDDPEEVKRLREALDRASIPYVLDSYRDAMMELGMNSPADVVPMTRQQIISMSQDDYANQVAPWTTEDSNDFDPTDPAQDAKFQRHMDAGRRWRASVAAAISLGELDPEVARERGFYGKPVDEWRTLPERTYHVTTAAEAIMATGLRTRRELALRNGKGLGAGPDDEISLTDNRVMADAIAAGMIEAGRMARGELTVHDMVAAAEAGVGADMPWMDKINRQFLGIEPEGNYTPEVQKMLDDERGVADGSLDPDEWIKTQETHLGIVHPGWEGVPGTETGQEAGTTGKPGFREMRQTRAADMADDRLRFYRNFAFWRQDAGGPLDPYFMGVDVADLARITPENVKVVEVERANPEVRGTFRLGLSEWRVPTGEALRPVLMRDPEPVTLSGREIDAMVMDSVMNSPAFPAAAAAGITVGPETPITRERADVVEAADREIARIAALWPGLRNSSFYAVDDEVSPVVEARDGGVAPDVVVSLGSQPLPREGGPWSDADLSPAAQARRHFYDGRGGPRKVNIHSYTDSKKDGSQVVVLTFDLVGDTSTHTVGGRLLARLTGRELRLDTELRDPRDPSRTITWSELSKETASEIRPRYGTKGWRSWADHGSRMVDGELRPEFDLSETDFPATREDLVRRFNTTVIHEIGHAVGAAILNDPDNPHREASYKRLFQQYGITPEEIAGVSKYATVSLAEAFAEMYAMRFSEMVDEMDPVLREKFDELLTNQLPDHQLPPVEVNPNQLSLSGMASPALPLAEARGFRTSRLEDAPGLASNPELTKVYDQTLAQLADRLPGLAEIPVLAHDDGRSRLLPDAPYYFRREGVTIQYSRTPKRGFAPLNTMTPKDRHIAELGSTTHLNDGDTIHRGVIVSSALALSGVNYSTFDRLTFLRDNATEGAQAIAVHEMGHIVGFSIVGFGPDVSHQEYIDLFKAYGVTPQEVAGVSEYATLTPAEAFAEIYTMFFTELRDDMDPSLRQKFENLMREEMPEHGLDPVRIVEAEESNASAYSPTPVTGMASPELPDRFGLPPYLGSELPRPLSRATTSDDLAGLWEQDAPTAMLDNLDLDSVTDEDVSRWRSVVYDLTQRSLLSRGLPEEFTVYRAGETYEGRPTNFRLTPGPYLGRPTTPYRVRREDIVIDSNAFFPYAFVGENEVVLRSGGLAQPETGMASPDEPSALPAVAALNSSLDTSAVTPLARRFPEQVSIMEDEFLRLNERWPEWKWYLDHLRLSDDERLVTTPWGKEKETSLIKDTTEGAYQIWWNEGNEENGWAAEKVRGMTIRLSRRGGDSHTVAGRLLESLTGTDLRRTLISWNADVEFGVSSSYDIWRRQGADDLTETGVATAEQVDRFFRIIVTHEIGHLVGEAILPFNSAYAAGDEHLAYRNLFKRYGITPEEIAGVSEYATTHPVEAFAEIYSMMFSEMVEEMDPALREKFESLLRSELPAHAIPEVRSVGVAPTGV